MNFLKMTILVITSSGPGNIEINHVNAQKVSHSKLMRIGLNIPMDNVMAIGDNNNNDVSMLKAAGISYAMGNGSDEVKMLANTSLLLKHRRWRRDRDRRSFG